MEKVLLVEETALQRAEQECLNDADACVRRREREAERRAELDIEVNSRSSPNEERLFR